MRDLWRVVPRGAGAGGPVRRVLVLQLGANPTTDYYLSPRLEASGLPWAIADLRGAADLGDTAGLWVIVVRYGAGRWIGALRRAEGLAGVSLMLDDDIPAMMFDRALPWSYRAHVAAWHGRHAAGLSRVVSEVWASTPTLAERIGATAVVEPLPEADPTVPQAHAPPLAVYHGGASHAAERRFVIAAARLAPEVRFELAGPPEPAPDNVAFVAETGWPAYLAAQAGRAAAVALAPLFASVVNEARAPVKVFDAARLGAAGLYADAPAYRGFVRDGIDGRLLPMRPEAWAEAIRDLIGRPERRLALAEAARTRLVDLRRAPSPLPGIGR